MAYFETNAPVNVGNDGNDGWGGNGGWWIVIILFALIFGWGGNGYGFGRNSGSGGNMDYELGRVATTNDVASGFSNSAVLSGLNDLKLGQAGIQQTLCQCCSGLNTAIAQNGYETRFAINDLGYRMQDCCCATQRAIDGVNYNMAKNTCDIIQAGHSDTQRIIDFMTNEKISSLQSENGLLRSQLSQNAQTATLNASIANAVSELRPVAKPAYITCSPYQSAYGYPYANGFYYGGSGNCGCGCGCGGTSIQ